LNIFAVGISADDIASCEVVKHKDWRSCFNRRYET